MFIFKALTMALASLPLVFGSPINGTSTDIEFSENLRRSGRAGDFKVRFNLHGNKITASRDKSGQMFRSVGKKNSHYTVLSNTNDFGPGKKKVQFKWGKTTATVSWNIACHCHCRIYRIHISRRPHKYFDLDFQDQSKLTGMTLVQDIRRNARRF